MYQVLIVIHAMVTFALIAVILVQRSASDGMGLSSSSTNGLMSGRTAASFVTRTTAVLATIFILLSLGIGILTARNHAANTPSIVDKVQATAPAKPEKPAVPRP